ncbi:hypothetical protein [Streptomonospora salina]|uniref:Spore coat protein CotH n=1 Tax=Streptomonospora salina TaxID=104205 RepID=A0A841E9X7_9ACTN|nr:hypothetical protein [Streptomonospora salina]MBB5999816.1 spore coat protein CotH [Streptomonospora salina]
MADADFAKLYEDAYADLYADLVDSGTAASLLDQAATQAQAAGGDDASQAREQLSEQIASIPETADDAASTEGTEGTEGTSG